ncbi:zinc finger CCCH domain-containing protein 14 [Pimephales promelas]|uniref:zinc finger CCCH domain-containing protein 14 n=1 Tax=Pimephales promelas TaxID=90988 RepID=UPI001955ECB8|nr:zinc finger CCCH domain-containing protein 14 [Pimephales promelas]KAG1938419.1 zinc finger CCCH domain-containing protein [Pimephales promelas]
MEIGTEISKKIRAAIKGKLQELGAYVDEELPDYIMVMVANKKNPQQMADDLSLFLGNNTIKFTVWLHGVLEKLRSVAVEPTSVSPSVLLSETSIPAESKRRGAEPRALAVSSSRSDKVEGRVSSSAHESRTSRRGSSERTSRLTSAVKPLMEASAEAVIDIKPDLDDDLIGYDPLEQSLTSGHTQVLYSRSTAERPRPALDSSRRTADAYRSADITRGQERSGSSHERGYRGSAESSRDLYRKRKAPVASSVVRVHRGHDHRGQEADDLDEEEEDEDEEDYGMASKVSLPSKPERKPSLPLAKQANKNLILKAISEAQQSISKTTTYTVPQRQTVPVAPRTRSASDEMSNAAIRLVQEHLHALIPQETLHSTQSRPLASRLQLELPEEDSREQLSEYELQVLEAARVKALDSRSFIMRKPELEQTPPVRSRLTPVIQAEDPPTTSRMVQAREKAEVAGGSSPKFIVTLDGVPSPLANRTDQEMEPEDEFNTTSDLPENNRPKPDIRLRLGTDFLNSGDGERDEVEDMDVEPVQAKRQKLPERCKFWPACKSGDDCLYHHPNTQCKLFPNCKFADKCLFIHPNCKFDAKCSKADCPFTHVSRRVNSNPPRAASAPAQASSVCRFFPECKKPECPFYHPKPCRFAAQCKRADCTFYHPSVAVPPRSALKWTKTQSS